MPKLKAVGTTLSYLPAYNDGGAVKLIGSLTSIGEIAPTSDEIDVTCLDSVGGFKEFIQGAKDSGEISISGFHDGSDTGQAQMRTLFASGATGYFWVTFPDATAVIITAFVKGYKAGAADVGGAVGFGASLRVTGLVQIISPALAVAQAKALNATATLVSTATAQTGTPTYQWKTCTDLVYGTPTNVVGGTGATTATYTTPALTPAGTKYYFCAITVTGYRPVNSQIHVIVVT